MSLVRRIVYLDDRCEEFMTLVVIMLSFILFMSGYWHLFGKYFLIAILGFFAKAELQIGHNRGVFFWRLSALSNLWDETVRVQTTLHGTPASLTARNGALAPDL